MWAVSTAAGPQEALVQSTTPVSRPRHQSVFSGWKSRWMKQRGPGGGSAFAISSARSPELGAARPGRRFKAVGVVITPVGRERLGGAAGDRVDLVQHPRETAEKRAHVPRQSRGTARQAPHQQGGHVTGRRVGIGRHEGRRGERRRGEQIEHEGLALRGEVRILELPFGARPAAQYEPMGPAVAVDDGERVVGVPATLGQAPKGGDAAAGANRVGDPAQRPLGRPPPQRVAHDPMAAARPAPCAASGPGRAASAGSGWHAGRPCGRPRRRRCPERRSPGSRHAGCRAPRPFRRP